MWILGIQTPVLTFASQALFLLGHLPLPEMCSYFIISKLQNLHSVSFLQLKWTKHTFRSNIIAGLSPVFFPSTCIEQGCQYEVDSFDHSCTSPHWGLIPSLGTALVRLNLLISVAITVMLCHSSVSRSRSFDVKIEPFPESMLNILSISVCLSTEYLKIQSRIYKDFSWFFPLSHHKTTPRIAHLLILSTCSVFKHHL